MGFSESIPVIWRKGISGLSTQNLVKSPKPFLAFQLLGTVDSGDLRHSYQPGYEMNLAIVGSNDFVVYQNVI